MKTKFWKTMFVAAGTALLGASGAQAVLIDYAADDTSTAFTLGGGPAGLGILDSQSDGVAGAFTSSGSPLLQGAVVEFKLALDSNPNGFAAFSTWIGGNSTGADVLIIDPLAAPGLEILLALEVNSISTGNVTTGASSSITIGSLQEGPSATSDLSVVGGTLAGQFGTDAHMALFLDNVAPDFPNDPFGFGAGALSSGFTGRTNVQIGFVATPEPGTASLLGTALLGLSGWRRSRLQ